MPAVKTNGYDAKELNRWIGEVERQEDQKAEIKARNAGEISQVVDRIKKIMKAAKSAGYPTKELKATLKLRALHRSIDGLAESCGLDDDETESFEQMQAALGMLADTPLGLAASKITERETARADAVNSILDDDADVRPGFLKPSADDVAAAENAAALAGLKGLN